MHIEVTIDTLYTCIASTSKRYSLYFIVDLTDKVIVGSFHGFLRIFNPRPVKHDDGSWSGFRPEDVMVETQLQFPILQVEAGIFIA